MFWEYTLICFLFLVGLWFLDVLILKTKVWSQPKFWIFLLIVATLQTIVDNYLNGRWFYNEPIVGPYNPNFYSNIKIWHTPLENYFFGFGLIGLNVILFEYFVSKKTELKDDLKK